MKNKEIAARFEAIAALMELLGENPFRVNSYHKAARAVEGLAENIETLSQQGRATEIAGIGESTAQKIEEYLKTGKIVRYDELAAKLPPHLPDLMALPGLGPKTAAKLWKEAGITSVEDLKQCIEKDPGRLTALEGMGEKKMRQLAESLAFVESTGGRMRLGEAARIASELVEHVSKDAPKGARVVAHDSKAGVDIDEGLAFGERNVGIAREEPADEITNQTLALVAARWLQHG